MKKQKSGYVKHLGEAVEFIRHDDSAYKYNINVDSTKLSKETIEEIRKHVKNAICGHFPIKKKPEKVWSVS